MANPREHIRAAQAAELKGDIATAVSELIKAAELYRQTGSFARALQLLRHARSLDPEQEELSEEVKRLEWLPDSTRGRILEEPETREVDLELTAETTPELAGRQRIIDAAMRGVSPAGGKAGAQDEVQRWLVENGPDKEKKASGQTSAAGQRALEWALEHAEEEEALAAISRKGAPEDSAGEEAPGEMAAPSEPAKVSPEEPSLIERGPTRADPAMDAWCSFCCRPRGEVGELVAGPAGAFICTGCTGESRSLLGLTGPEVATARPQPSTPRPAAGPEVFELVGQAEPQALLEKGILAGARRMLILGPEGVGKTLWFHALAKRAMGTVVSLETLEQGSGNGLVLLEDVDRLPAEAQIRLGTFLSRHPDRVVMMSARGSLSAEPPFKLRGGTGSLLVRTTEALSKAVQGTMPLSLLEQVQLCVALQAPTEAEYAEIARRRLAPRAPESTVSPEVISLFAAEAARSPRAGHELNALLNRVLAGAWSLDTAKPSKPAPKRRRRKEPA
ncbi:ClpX C4-type zinc finger protein [Stigmatella sp. ncwal1]|uniref:ClpX C4-type zinc finger protein n=1 Tax=Stigmatella ashevillensis TaxID=2995309 RepID=A0ABT5D6W1_9BACT|nr:ClpX C4-type zinc finger protein [Stigmatella ashevillena]MDC0707987.1 ClpX C4-type zinc finger protein [Stigmatella ashevillena]